MICQRCRGLLVRETFGDLRGETACLSPAIRCINCGYIEDSVVRANRLHPLAEKRTVSRGVVGMGRAVFMKTQVIHMMRGRQARTRQ